MVLRTFNSEIQDFKLKEQMNGIQDIWTIDLAYILQKYELSFTFYTLSTEVNAHYQHEEFYQSCMNDFAQESERINSLFQSAKLHNIRIIQRSVHINEIVEWILSGNLLILLINDAIRVFPNLPKYCGHFIVACGVDVNNKTIFYKDPSPSFSSDVLEVSFEVFDKMRKSFGTDEDILLINTKIQT